MGQDSDTPCIPRTNACLVSQRGASSASRLAWKRITIFSGFADCIFWAAWAALSASQVDEGPIRACLEGDDRNSTPQAGKKQWGGRSLARGRRVEVMRSVAWARQGEWAEENSNSTAALVKRES